MGAGVVAFNNSSDGVASDELVQQLLGPALDEMVQQLLGSAMNGMGWFSTIKTSAKPSAARSLSVKGTGVSATTKIMRNDSNFHTKLVLEKL
jgi:hypothetical protein